ncbi:hypothetical protein SNE40_017043 [Patella caerulea]|uniref:WAP domain-containing protein n=1 Tax=Patella caerulea TaxID=87958 RepID=A0AAN8J9N2_PATCE
MNTALFCLVLVCLAVGGSARPPAPSNDGCPAPVDPTLAPCTQNPTDLCKTDDDCSSEMTCCPGTCGAFCHEQQIQTQTVHIKFPFEDLLKKLFSPSFGQQW